MNLILVIVILAREWSATRLIQGVKLVDGINVNVVLVDVITKGHCTSKMEENPCSTNGVL